MPSILRTRYLENVHFHATQGGVLSKVSLQCKLPNGHLRVHVLHSLCLCLNNISSQDYVFDVTLRDEKLQSQSLYSLKFFENNFENNFLLICFINFFSLKILFQVDSYVTFCTLKKTNKYHIWEIIFKQNCVWALVEWLTSNIKWKFLFTLLWFLEENLTSNPNSSVGWVAGIITYFQHRSLGI